MAMNKTQTELLRGVRQEDLQVIANCLKKLNAEADKLHERYVKVPIGKYDDRANKIRWRLNEVRMEIKALEQLKQRMIDEERMLAAESEYR